MHNGLEANTPALYDTALTPYSLPLYSCFVVGVFNNIHI